MLHLLQTTCIFYGPPLISASAETGDKWKVTPKRASLKRVCVAPSVVPPTEWETRTMILPNESENAMQTHLRLHAPTPN